MDYDFSKLNDREFEYLGASIIEKILSNKVEKFRPGKDGGVDGRFWIGNKKEGIIQCKHYIQTPYRQLVSKLKRVELDKVKNLKPGRYIFITSKSLSRPNKQEIKNIFNPFILHEVDIFGADDLQSFLAKKENQDIVEQHFKLWMTSTIVLDLIYNNAIKGRSKSTLLDIKQSTDKYVVTQNHLTALQILEKHNVVILTGEPGIGKTTLADNLSLHYLAKGYEFCDIEENISDAESPFREQEKKKILFYCDDFLGSNLYDAINNKRDSHIVKFIDRIIKDKSKKFILTSRTNILNKAYSLSHRFQNGQIRDNEFLLRVENLTTIDKAQILYNHIYHSKLSDDYIDEIYKDKKYKDIIAHRNYNPRIIEFITDNVRIGTVVAKNYWAYIIKNLNNPEQIWADYFQHQTDDCIRALTFLTVYNKGQISEETLRISYEKFLKMHNVNLGDYSDKSFVAVSKLALKSLLNRNQIDENTFEYTLFNPSIADFVLNSYSEESDLVSNIIKSLETETALEYFSTLAILKKISPKTSKKIHTNLFDYFFENKMKEEDWDFLITLSYIDFFNPEVTDRIEHFLKTLIENEYASGHKLSELLSILADVDSKIEISNYSFLHGFIDNIQYDDDLKKLLDFIDENNIDMII
jgi:adenylate kinase family enzyme